MTYDRFEQLPVWQAAIKLGQEIYAFTSKPGFRRQRSLRDQIERATVSISNNPEGFERGTTQELLTFLYIARGSAGEVRSMRVCSKEFPNSLVRPAKVPYLSPQNSPISNLKSPISNPKPKAFLVN